jgi:hypothetical protein
MALKFTRECKFMKTHITLLAFFLVLLAILFSCSFPAENRDSSKEDSSKEESISPDTQKGSSLLTSNKNSKEVSADSEGDSFTVVFDSQGGSPVKSQTVSEGSLLVKPEIPVLAGKVFVGWLEPQSGKFWDFNKSQVFSDLTLYAQWINCTEGLEYTLINGDTEYSVSKGTADTSSTVLIPEYWDGKKVTAVSDDAFFECDRMTLVYLPESITSIGYRAFAKCTNLSIVNLPASVAYIGAAAFTGCSNLISMTIPEGVTNIGETTFALCSNLISVTLPESVSTIGNSAFYSCYNLKTVKMPQNAESMGEMVFAMCRSLEEISIPVGITSVKKYSFYNCTSLKSVLIPDVISIDQAAFFNCSSLLEIELMGSLETIGMMAFRSCSSLSTITIHAVVPPSLDSYVFSGCSRISAILVPPESVKDYKSASGWSDYSSKIISQ